MKTVLYPTAKALLLLTFLISLTPGYAQAPEKMSYQAVVRDKSNKLLINQPIGAKMSIIQGSEEGKTVYAEIFNPNPETNVNGLLTLELGNGNPVLGTFTEIEWSKGPYFIRTEIDPEGGSNYSVTGISQLLSVPYAHHAKTVENVDDADSDPTNELQVLNLDGTSLSLSKNGGTVTLPSGFALPYNGNVSSSGNAFSVENQGSGGGIRALTPTGVGVYGNTTSSTGLGYGIMGSSASSDGRGIYGEASSVSGMNYGVFGRSASTAGYGVFGWATSTTGLNYGVSGLSGSTTGRGVYGVASSVTGTNYGVFGKTNSSQGHGVYGIAESLTGNTYSVMGENKSSTGTGVYGVATSNSGVNYGVRGITSSSSGRGVYGYAGSLSGETYGVWGESRSNSGFSGYFTGGKFYVSGRTGINTESPVTTLHVRHKDLGMHDPLNEGLRLENSGSNSHSWTLFADNGSDGYLFLYANNRLRGGFSGSHGVYTSLSNRRLKTDITALDGNILERVMKLQPVSYRFISHPQSTSTIGFIAEDALPLFPELVQTSLGNEENLGVNYAGFSVVAIKAIQQQQKQIEVLQTENEQLKQRLDRLEQIMASTAEKASK